MHSFIIHDVKAKRIGFDEGGPHIGQMPQSQPIVGDTKSAHNVVMELVDGLWNVGSCMTMNNFFSSIGLYTMLLLCGIYTCGTIRANHIGLL